MRILSQFFSRRILHLARRYRYPPITQIEGYSGTHRGKIRAHFFNSLAGSLLPILETLVRGRGITGIARAEHLKNF